MKHSVAPSVPFDNTWFHLDGVYENSPMPVHVVRVLQEVPCSPLSPSSLHLHCLLRDVARATEAAAASKEHGGKTPLHLVVMGHVDAGGAGCVWGEGGHEEGGRGRKEEKEGGGEGAG